MLSIYAKLFPETRRLLMNSRCILIKSRRVFLSSQDNLTMPKFTLHFFVTLLKNSTDKISLTKRLYILPLQR